MQPSLPFSLLPRLHDSLRLAALIARALPIIRVVMHAIG
jgi:hypothetical protein